jgi:MoaA/NifB/PqqE/SkfB family radical SAM enzyme
MKAVKGVFTQTDRQFLGDIVPLKKPITMCLEVSSYCDLRCEFCTFSNPEALKRVKHINHNMSLELVEKIIEQSKEFPSETEYKYAIIHLAGLGEVLCNPNLTKIVEMLKKSNIARSINMYTNGILLTNETALALVDAGLDSMLISVNGLDSSDYEKYCKRNIDYDKYYEQIKFLYNNKKQLRIDVKTTDAVADTPEREKLFYDMYGDYCDRINIETVADFHKGAVLNGTSGSLSRHGDVFERSPNSACAWAFYKLVIFSDGRINFCECPRGPVDGLNMNEQTLKEIWDGEIYKNFLLSLLSKDVSKFPTMCQGCIVSCATYAFKEEQIDPYADLIKERILANQYT